MTAYRRAPNPARPAPLLVALLAAGVSSFSPIMPATGPTSVAAAGTTFYVDGKHGNDANSGTSWQSAFKTISAAARKVPHGAVAGWTVVVRGYADYLYRERPVPGGYDRWGASGSPLVFEAEGWTAGGSGYVKPIVSGGAVAPHAGQSWVASGMPKVWYTPWSSAPQGFDANAPYLAALFQNNSLWLWQRASLAQLRDTVGDGLGGYWFDDAANRLYLVARNGVDPSTVNIEVPTNNGFYFSGKYGARYIQVRGFEIRHAAMGIAFVDGTDYSRAVDNVVNANSHLGIHVAGLITGSSSFNAAIGNQILRNSGSYNTVQAIKIDSGAQGTTVCDNTATGNGLQGIKVQGPSSGASDPRVTRDTEVCGNDLSAQNVPRPDQDYDNATGLTIADGALNTNVHDNRIWDNHVGIHVTEKSGAGLPVSGTLITNNLVWGNDRFGLNFRDGIYSSAQGSGSATSSHNLYWANGIGVQVDVGSTHKVFDHDTAYDNATDGFKIGCGCSTRAASATIRNSLSTHNGTYGVQIMPGHLLTLSYVGLPSNAAGAISGSATKTAVNTMAAGYLSKVAGDPDFLRVATSSYQYHAGPSSTPIGARW